ncbi:MAG TPA: alpha/beta fold hydrolase [Erysipelotrichaceae bacterium]|nr:alpha/beta fold hydrolase [Erysipelotrichaceae bacterium]
MDLWLIILIAGLGLIAFFFIVLFIVYLFVFYSPLPGQMSDKKFKNLPQNAGYEKIFIEMITALMEIPYEEAYINSFDNLKLYAKVYKNKSSNKVAILCHGFRATGYRDFAGIAKGLIDEGLNVILIDQRAHGKSQGHSITFGIKEVKDVLGWIKYARKEFGEDKQIILMGFSMGGATVLNLANKVRDDTIIIADSPYCSPREIMKTSIKSVKLPASILYPIVNLSSIVFARTNLNQLDAYEAIKNTKCKILIIHGTNDRIVPHVLSQKLAETYKEKIKYELFEGAKHGVSYLRDIERYQKVVINFVNKD